MGTARAQSLCWAMLCGGLTILEESGHDEERCDHRNMKPVESSGGNKSQGGCQTGTVSSDTVLRRIIQE